jgi:hypothetical protein
MRPDGPWFGADCQILSGFGERLSLENGYKHSKFDRRERIDDVHERIGVGQQTHSICFLVVNPE